MLGDRRIARDRHAITNDSYFSVDGDRDACGAETLVSHPDPDVVGLGLPQPRHQRMEPDELGSRPRARGLARRDARRFDHVTLTRGAAALAVATSTLAVPLPSRSKLQPHNALGNPRCAPMSR